MYVYTHINMSLYLSKCIDRPFQYFNAIKVWDHTSSGTPPPLGVSDCEGGGVMPGKCASDGDIPQGTFDHQ
jgi:hypothetical protein